MLQPPPQRQGDAALGDRGRRLPRALSGGPDWLRRKRLWAGLLAGALVIGGGGVLVSQRRSSQQQRNLESFTVLARRGTLPGVITAPLSPAAKAATFRDRSRPPFLMAES